MATEEEHPCVDLNTKYPDVVVKVGKVIFGETYRKEKNKQHIKKKQKENISQAACALLNSGGGLIEAEIENEGYNEGDGLGKDIEDSFTELIPSQMFADYFESIKQNSKLLIFVKSWRIEVSSSSDISSSSRICSQKTGLYQRCGTSVKLMSSSVAAQFFKRKKECSRRRSDETEQGAERAVLNGVEEEHDSIENIFNVQHLTHGEKLNFSESTRVDYKEFASADNLNIIQKDIEDKLPKYISAFANTQGGYLFFGVDDERKVVGCRKENVTANQLLRIVERGRQKVQLVFHFCSSQPELIVVPKILNVQDNQGNLYGYVCAVKIKPFCCAVFLHNPNSWIVKDDRFQRLMAEDWMDLMTTSDPEISNLAEVLKTVLSLSGASPLSKPVFSNKGLMCLSDLRNALFPVIPNRIIYTPENLTEGLFSEYPGLENLMKEQMEELHDSQGLLIFSRSWAVDIGLPENQQVVCEALLIAAGKHPTLYSVTQKDCSANMFEYARQTARALKQKLVNVGGYTQRVCVIPHLLQLGTSEEGNTELGLQVKYPASYTVSQKDIRKLLDSLVIILLGFRSFLSDRLGCEFFNLLTIKQYEILSKDLHKCRKLFIYGLPGTGKTIVALKIIEKIRHMFRCQSDEILYICENAPLKTFVSEKGICQVVTRVTFMKKNFEKVKHIVVDEAQNFREEDGRWNTMTMEESPLCVDWFTDYPDAVLKVGKVTFGEKSRKKMTDCNLRRKQVGNISRAACAFLNSGGGVIKAEVDNKDYNYEEHGIGQDIEKALTELTPSKMSRKYFDFEYMRENNCMLIFVKSWSSDGSSSPRICSLRTGLCQRSLTRTDNMSPTEAVQFLKEKEVSARRKRVNRNGITYKPDNLSKELFSEYPGLEDLMNEQMEELQYSQGLLIFARSWAVAVGLPEDQHVVCDALLIAAGKYPTLYTVTEDCSMVEPKYSKRIACTLKKKLVNDGGYTQKVCVIPHLLQLGTNRELNNASHVQVKHPLSYVLLPNDMPDLLHSLVIILLSFRSFLSDMLGCEFFNLLTVKQYEILTMNLHKFKKLFIYGLPGTGKTVVALNIIERIKNVFHCESDEILYICEYQPLTAIVKRRNICQPVTRVAFLKGNYQSVKHIVIDEAQNFRSEDGDWYSKAQCITQGHGHCEPGVLWIFLDYLQTSHPFPCGLPHPSEQYPQEWLTIGVRNATQIYNTMEQEMQNIVKYPQIDIPFERLRMLLNEAVCGHPLPGVCRVEENLEEEEIVTYVVDTCRQYFRSGYSGKDIAILCNTMKEKDRYQCILQPKMRATMRNFKLDACFTTADNVLGHGIVLDSIRRFSGLERNIVFGINPVPVPTQNAISENLKLCVASRANLQLHLLYER
ncbi:Schlafen family member 13 [Chelonia mydas]|uniref:Schlafen family member 13 n=1 Tax=Chelonia mydas TaxID=8469 RepID=M7B9Q5_CHEMY|nr:Schlafen family member 13 [Chelonia mydas]